MRLLRITTLLGLALAAAGIVWTFTPTPGVDMTYSPLVKRPGYGTRRSPRVLIDENHANTHHAHGLYGPLARLLTRDGYRVSRNRQALIPELLDTYSIVIIANPRDALLAGEVEAVRRWVRDEGGGLLLIADRAAAIPNANALAAAFGAQVGDTSVAEGSLLAGDHPILAGRHERDLPVESLSLSPGPPVSLTGPGGAVILARRAVAIDAGRGRVVVLTDAGVLSAQVNGDGTPKGINERGGDNGQFAVNVLHWLSKLT